MSLDGLFGLALGAILVNNLVLARLLGLCPVVGCGRRTEDALAMGAVVTAVATAVSAAGFALDRYLLTPLGAGHLGLVGLVCLVGGLGRAATALAARVAPRAPGNGAAFPMVAVNCAVLGVALINREAGFGALAATVHGFSAGLGFSLVAVLLAGLRERLDLAPVPRALQGVPITLILAGLMAMAFSGFSGMIAG